jgi:hypothetical protein
MFGKLQVPAEPFERPNPDRSIVAKSLHCLLTARAGRF